MGVCVGGGGYADSAAGSGSHLQATHIQGRRPIRATFLTHADLQADDRQTTVGKFEVETSKFGMSRMVAISSMVGGAQACEWRSEIDGSDD